MSKVAKIAAVVIAVAAAIPSGGTSLLAAGVAAAGVASGAAAVAVASAIAIGSNLAVGLLSPRTGGTGGGTQTDWSADPRAPIPIRFGRTGGAGNIVYRKGSGEADKNQYQTLTTVLSGAGPIDAIEASYADKKLLTFTGAAANAPFSGWLWEVRQLGLCPEPAALNTGVGNKPGWTADHKLSSLAAVQTTLRYDSTGKGTFMTEPGMLWVTRGVRCYDPRLDSTYPGGSGPQRWFDQTTWAFSKNPYIVGLTWAIGWKANSVRVAGVGIHIRNIEVSRFVEGANVADFNGWTCGGEVSTGDDKWQVLKSILQAGSGEPLKDGATLSCMVNAPRVPIATITRDDVVGEVSAPRTQPRRDRVNGIIPTYRSEAHFWEVVPGEVVRDAAMLAKDGDERTKEIAYGLVQVEGSEDVQQTVELAGYDLENAREAGPITMPLKLRWIGFRAGDCVTIDADETGLSGKQIILLKRSLDPATGMVPMTMRTEDPTKHARVFARTGTLPPIVVPVRPDIPGDYSENPIADELMADVTELQEQFGVATGWANYAHTGGAVTIAANTRTQLIINAGTKIETQKPSDISALWDGTASRITGRNGDAVGARIRLIATPTDATASTLKVEFDISGTTPVAPGVDPIVAARTEALISGAAVPQLMTLTELLFMGATFAANGCAVWVTSDGPVTITSPSIHIQVTHRAR
ncbi:hypothetical protein ASE67_02675 [Sphingomonas sp. Leaf23]|uniref:hypothetical protein n=1 Tax=Sphingomonas sp. Leaf23 TaxID=1735689 RepID=UPI0006F79CD8|nr:hypothetical protein [Sphingomonas sp. Leaf23]KQM88664.1 hypothetical protein ASE67_02675 [Sphingomonas sp. Leaf23]